MWLKGLCEMFAAEGLDVAAMLQECGANPSVLVSLEQRFPADVVERLWELAGQRCSHPNPGLKRELCDRYGGFRLMEFSLAGCAMLKEGMARLQRFMALLSEAASFSMIEAEEGCWLQLGLADPAAPVSRQRVAFGLLSILMQASWLVRYPVVPLQVEFAFDEPPGADDFEQAFLCRPSFGRRHNRMLISHYDLNTVLPTHNPVVSSLHEQLLQEHLLQLGHTSTRYRVLSEITRRLKSGEPRRADIAAALYISDRTLQRRLNEENVSYQQLLNEARMALARQYLADKRLSLAEVSDLLGFVDQSNFHRASKRWFGKAPGQVRGQFDPG